MNCIQEALYNLGELFDLEESKREEKNIKSNMRILLLHMLKCKYQNDYPTKSSWRDSIFNSYYAIKDEFKDIGKGSLYKKFYMKEFNLDSAYDSAKRMASKETGLPINSFPLSCEWTKQQLMDEEFIYNFVDEYGKDSEEYKQLSMFD